MPGELEPVLPPPNLQGVPAQMSQIFADAGVPDAAMGALRSAQVSALRPQRSGARPMTVLAIAAAGLVGLGAGAFVIRTPSQPSAVTPPPAQAAPTPAVVSPKAAPATLSTAASEPPLILAPPLKEAAAEPPVRQRARPRPALAKAVRRERAPMAQPASCEKDAVGAGCRRAVVQADRHLRNVYETAIRRGVPRAVLIDYRDRWADLRETDNNDPVHLIRGYGALAYDLGREARDDREGASRRRNPSGLKALASALLPWW